MITSLVVAADERGGIGLKGKIPWHMPADLHYFKQVTMGHPIIMGRKTYDSIGHPLPGRRNIVVTHQEELVIPGCDVVHSVAQALELAKKEGAAEVFVIGGGQIYKEAMEVTDKIYLTRIHTTVQADTFFPEVLAAEWEEVQKEERPADEKNPYAQTYLLYARRGKNSVR